MHEMPQYRIWTFRYLKMTFLEIQMVTLNSVKDHSPFVSSECMTPFVMPKNIVIPTWGP